jgi:hypothetical protein
MARIVRNSTVFFSLLLILSALIGCRAIATYDQSEAYRSLYLSCAAFCDPATYSTKTYSQASIKGFNATLTIHDDHYGTYGFVGYLSSSTSIYVTYRGSEGWRNWMADLETTSMDFPYCSGCKVHHGFYTALMNSFPSVLAEVKRLQKQFPNYVVKTTGHSLGAALSQLASVQLAVNGVAVHASYNFGQPRTGNAKYSAFVASKVPVTFRHVHFKDPVPHVPPTEFGFQHECTEKYEPKEVWDGTLETCGAAGNCEDSPSCALEWKDYQLVPDDHMTYLGVPIQCY